MRTAVSATLQHVCRESKKSAQQILHQLEQLSLPLLEGLDSQLCKAITYDASLSSWQELYRLISCLDFGAGLATGCATLQLVGHNVCACGCGLRLLYVRILEQACPLAVPLFSWWVTLSVRVGVG